MNSLRARDDRGFLASVLNARTAFILVILLTFLCFLPALQNGLLLWDDDDYVTNNVQIRSLSLETLRWAFVTFHRNYWTPLTWISYSIDYAVWGLNPVGFHLTNIFFHACNAGLFFLLALELFKIKPASGRQGTTPAGLLNDREVLNGALLASLFFGIHPLRVESVAWVTERKDVLSLFFGLAAILSYVRHCRSLPERQDSTGSGGTVALTGFFGYAIAFHGFSLLSKAMFITLPFVLLVLDWYPLGRMARNRLKPLLLEKVPFVALAALTSLVSIVSQQSDRQVAIFMPLSEANVLSRLLNAAKSIMSYLWFMIWPFDISPFYLHPLNITTVSVEYYLAIFLIIAVTAASVALVRRWPAILAAWMIFLVTLLPVLGFIQNGPQAMAARFTYLPGLSLTLLLALGVTIAGKRLADVAWRHHLLVFGTVIVLVTNGIVTVRHIAFWKDDVALWSRVIDLKPHFSGRTYFQRAYAYAVRGEYDRALADMDEALAIASRKSHRQIYTLYLERARIHRSAGDLKSAITDYTRAIETATAAQFSGLSSYYRERGLTYEEMGRHDLAEEDFRSAGGSGDTP